MRFDYSQVDWRFASEILNENSVRLSRTRAGMSDTRSSRGKRPLLLTGADLKQRAAENEARAHQLVFEQRLAPGPTSGEAVQELLFTLADLTNEGLLPAGRLRAWPLGGEAAAWHHGALAFGLPAKVAPEALPEAIASFCTAVQQRWPELEADPVPLASWAEWMLNSGPLHPFYDACGRISRSFAALLLIRSACLLPLYEDRETYYAHADSGSEAFCDYVRERITACAGWLATCFLRHP